MSEKLTRREALGSLVALSAGLGSGSGVVGAAPNGGERADDHGGAGLLNRFATTVEGAEFTGVFLTKAGQLFFNVQHPDLPGGPEGNGYEPGAIGAVVGVDLNRLPRDFESVQPPEDAVATRVRTAKGNYQVIAEGGEETKNGRLLGVPYAADGTPMSEVSVAEGEPVSTGASPDFNGYVPAETDGEGYLFTNWETTPGMVTRLRVRQSSALGPWEVLERENLDFRPVEGTWNNCFGTVTPWGTPLTSEEYPPAAADWWAADSETYGNAEAAIERYLGRFGNAYRYGYIVEIGAPRTDPTPTKHYAMGRFSHENAVVMPDERTVYMSDDGTGTVFFKFVADEAGDLSAGTLYAARAVQQAPSGAAVEDVSFRLKWIELGHASDEQVRAWIEEYDGQEPSADPNYVTDEDVRRWANGEAEDDRAAFLESTKAAGAVGATDEFRKMEGVDVKPGAKPGDSLYMAMSEVNETMLADGAEGGESAARDHVRVKGNDYGAVYRMELDRNYDVKEMVPVVVGGPDANVCGGCPYDARPGSNGSVCRSCAFNPDREDDSAAGGPAGRGSGDARGVRKAVRAGAGLVGGGMRRLTDVSRRVDPRNAVANPDNLRVMPDGRVIIGEDSDHHRPNMLWIYDPRPAAGGEGASD